MKKVWIGKDDAEFWDDLNKLPGDLLAEVTTQPLFTSMGYYIHTPLPDSAPNKKEVTVLILTSKEVR